MINDHLTYHIEGLFLGNVADFHYIFNRSAEHYDIIRFAIDKGLKYDFWSTQGTAGKIKKGSKVLWHNKLHTIAGKNDVEAGDVIGVWGNTYSVIWLEGYKSRSESLREEDILAVWDPKSPMMRLNFIEGNSLLTKAGHKWVEEFLTGERQDTQC